MTHSADHAVLLDGSPLSIPDLEAVACRDAGLCLEPRARSAMEASLALVEQAIEGDEPVYGVNTGFGALSQVRLQRSQVSDLQRNLVRSTASGVGSSLSGEVVRAMLCVLAASLARGRSGVRPILLETIIELLAANVTPCVPERGSVGASGDLAPLAHAALVLIGEGEAIVGKDPGVVSGMDALSSAGISPLTLEGREGLALLNGTHLMAGVLGLVMADVERLVSAATVASAMAIDSCLATDAFLDERLHAAREHPGQARVAMSMRGMLVGSEIVASHRDGDPRVQDPYSIRCAPQVLGATVDALDHGRAIVERELGSVTDNPIVLATDNTIVSGGNFHGMPLAIAAETASLALSHLAGISERRTFWVLSGRDAQNPLPPFLSPEPGLHSGYMVTQYTAAACCNELRVLALPASPANLPTCAGIEDYNSWGATSSLRCRRAVVLATEVVAIELLVMAEAMEHHRPLRSGEGVERAYELVREVVPRLEADRPPAPDIAALVERVRAGDFTP